MTRALLARPRSLVTAALALSAAALAACTPPAATVCDGLDGTLPTTAEVAQGKVVATRGTDAFSESGSWSVGPNASLNGGLLSMIIARAEGGEDTSDLIDQGAFPICIQLGARDAQTGQASLAGSDHVTNDTHGGTLAILGRDGTTIIGRFAVDLVGGDGSVESFTDGAFRVDQLSQ